MRSQIWISITAAVTILTSSVLCGSNTDLVDIEPTGEDQTPSSQRMSLNNQSVCFGEIVGCPQPGLIGWRNQGFDTPFFFELSAVRSINRIRAADQPLRTVQPYFRVKAISGDVFAGMLVRLDAERLTVNSPVLGEVEIDREHVVSLVKAGLVGEAVYPGLIERENWRPLSQPEDWDTTGGVITALRQGASIIGDLSLPEKCHISLSMVWKGVPDFVLSFGTDSKQQRRGPVPASARVEVWNRNMVLVRETRQSADLTRLAELSPSINQIELIILLDQSRGLVSVLDYSGRPLGTIVVPSTSPSIDPGIRIDNHGPSLTIERLEVHHWDGVSLLESDQTNCVVLSSGEIKRGTVIELAHESNLIRLESTTEKFEELDLDQVAFIGLNPPTHEPRDRSIAAQATVEVADQDNLEVEVVLADSSRLVAHWLPRDDAMLGVSSNCWQRDFEFLPQHLISVTPTHQRILSPSTDGRNGILTIGDSKIPGILEELSAETSHNALRWKPHGSANSCPLPQIVAGSIVYEFHDARSRSHVAADRRADSHIDGIAADFALAHELLAHSEVPAYGQSVKSLDETLERNTHTGWPINFVSGDTIDGEIFKIDQDGIHLRSSDTPIRFAAHEQVANVWLNAMSSGVKPPEEFKAARLMQLPRNMKDDPPSHLLLAVDGDLLRCRLIELDTSQAVVEVRGGIVHMARKQISQIVWLHSRNWNDQGQNREEKPIESDANLREERIHVMLNGRGVTLVPQQVRSGLLLGESELLGTCRISIKELSQILFGPQLDARVAELHENPWILTEMPSPKALIQND